MKTSALIAGFIGVASNQYYTQPIEDKPTCHAKQDHPKGKRLLTNELPQHKNAGDHIGELSQHFAERCPLWSIQS